MNKPTGRHKTSQLTVKKIEAISKPGRYSDGDGLYLVADNKNAKRWLLRIIVQGRRRDIGLGSYKNVSLAAARDRARDYRRDAREGLDPTVTQRKSADIKTFEQLAREYHTKHKAHWKNPKHRQQWINTLTQYAFPSLGHRRIDEISTPEIVSALSPIWHTKLQTAQRVKQRIATVFNFAKGQPGQFSGENPVNGVGDILKVDRKKNRPRHFKAIRYQDLPEFMKWLRNDELPTMSRLGLEFTVLCACRTGETIGAKWTEIDMDKALWTIPAERMKMDEEHCIPLTSRCLEILEVVAPVTKRGGWLFESNRSRRPMSNMAMLQLLKRHGWQFTIHGMRSCFRDWCANETGFPPAAVERCLAHGVQNKSEAAYHRTDYLERRKEIMSAWQAYALSEVDGSQNVVSIAAGR